MEIEVTTAATKQNTKIKDFINYTTGRY